MVLENEDPRGAACELLRQSWVCKEMCPMKKLANIKVELVIVITPSGLHALILVSTTLICATFFMGCIYIHMQEPFSERIIVFYYVIVSEVHILHPWDLLGPLFLIPSKLNQIIFFLKVWRISTRGDDSNAPKIIVVCSVDPEILHSEL